MPGYIERALQRFAHKCNKSKDLPHAWTKPNFGASVQYATEDMSPLLDAKDKKRVQEVVETLLFHARAVDSTMLPTLNTIEAAQSNSTQNTMEALTKLLNYCATHPNATVQAT